MRPPRVLIPWFAWFLCLSMTGRAADSGLIPITEFARTPEFFRLQISMGGSRIGYVREVHGRQRLYVAPVDRLDQAREVRLDRVGEKRVNREVSSFTWISDERLLVTTAVANLSLYGVFAIDWDGRRRVGISGNELDDPGGPEFFATNALYAFEDAGPSILMSNNRTRDGDARLFPDIVRVDTRSGRVTPVLKNPGNVVAWGVDLAGEVRLGVTSDAGAGTSLKLGAVYREDASTPWRTLLEPAPIVDRIRPLDFDGTSDQLFVATWSPTRRVAVHRMDPATGALGPELVSDPEYDVVPDEYRPSFAGVGLGDTVSSQAKGGIVGVRYCTDRIVVRWFDDEYAARQAAIDSLLPDTVNLVCGATRDEEELLVLAFSDRHSGAFFLYDSKTNSVRLLGTRLPGLDPARLAPMQPVDFMARDGVKIHGYLTVPKDAESNDLPLVVVPHGGPSARDTWGFDTLVQLLASRGYAVLQPNFRGSTGYGRDFFEMGRREVGGRMQDDIEDATRWAIAAGIADPDRIAIIGVSFGGYAALFALGHNPELYRCGVSFAGVTDWMEIFAEGARRSELALARAYWIEKVGDPEGDEERLRAASPVNFADRITAPVLLVHGRGDRNVPVAQTRAMIAALKRVGRAPESLLLSNEGHTFADEKSRVQAFTRLLDFLAMHLAPRTASPHVGR